MAQVVDGKLLEYRDVEQVQYGEGLLVDGMGLGPVHDGMGIVHKGTELGDDHMVFAKGLVHCGMHL